MSEWTGVISRGLPSTAIASSGAAMIGMQSRNRQTCSLSGTSQSEETVYRLVTTRTAQKTNGVMIHVLYGLSNMGSLTRKITSPNTYARAVSGQTLDTLV